MVKLKIKKSHLFLIIVIILAVIFAWFNSDDSKSNNSPKTISKDSAYYKCLSKSKECSESIPAVRLEFMKSCKDIYMYTADSKELVDFTNGMC